MARKRKLTEKQRRFVAEYLIDLCAKAAAKRAGYSEKSAEVLGYQLLQNPLVRAAVEAAQSKRISKLELTADLVLGEIKRLAFSDVRKLFNADGTLRDIQALDDDTAAAISSIEVNEIGNGKDQDQPIVLVKKIRLWDKRGSLELLGKHLKLFTEQVIHSGRIDLAASGAERFEGELARIIARAQAETTPIEADEG